MPSLPVLRRLVPLLAVVAVATLPSGARAASYSRSGPFLDFATMAPLGRDHVPIRLRGGVPEVFYPFAGWQPNHITAAQYGLGEHAAWLATGRRARLRHALSVAKWFVHTQHADGTWRYSFAFDPFGETLPVGWISAMAQGEGISLLTRAYRVTRRPAYRRSAVRALKPFLKTVAEGGVVRHYAGHPWYEEYPTRSRPSFVLNGFMFSLLGLYDLAPYSRTAARRYRDGRKALVAALPAFDNGKTSVYDLWTRQARGPYNRVHVTLLNALDYIGPNKVLAKYASRFVAYDWGE